MMCRKAANRRVACRKYIGLALALALASLPAIASDLSNSTWSETDASNNSLAPEGWRSGVMTPSQVEPTARAMMGAIKRFYNHINSTVTSGGSANAQTLTYTVAPAAYVKGDSYAFIAGFTNTGATTLNVNGLGAKNILVGSTALTAGRITAGQAVAVYYDGTQFQLPAVNPSAPGLSADNTGTTSVTADVQAAITSVCLSASPSLYIPPGTYKFLSRVTIPAGCDLRLWADPGNATFIADAANVDAVAQILEIDTANRVELHGLIFDGNVDGGNTNISELIHVTAPTSRFTFSDNVVQNTYSDGLTLVGEARTSGDLNTDADVGQADLVFAAVPAGVKNGAQTISNLIDVNSYVTNVTATTVTLNQNLTDTVKSGKTIAFTDGFTTSAAAHYGDLTLSTADTTGLEIGQTIYSNTTPQCVQSKTKISAVTVNTSVTIDRKIICDIASGDLLAAAKGNSEVTAINNSFRNIGQPQIYGSTSTVSYNTVGIQASGQATLVLACDTGAGCDRAGVVPGQKTGASPPAGVPASTLVIGGPTSVDSPSGSYTVTLASNLTGAIADGTAIPFNVSRGGKGFPIWHSFGAWFANRDSKYVNNLFYHAWVAPLFIKDTGYTLLQGNQYILDGLEFVDPNVAPSPCINGGGTVGLQLVGEICKGASGNGLELGHMIGLTISGSQFVENGKSGVQVCSGKNISIGGGSIFRNNGQYKNRPYITDQSELGQSTAGIKITGSCTFGQPGTQTNISIDNVVVVDDQATATQEYGIAYRDTQSTFVNLRLGPSITGSGNSTAFIDPFLKLTEPVLLTSSGDWVAPWSVCSYMVMATAGGAAGGGVAAAAATAASGTPGMGATWTMTPTYGATMAYTIGAGGTPGAAGANSGGNGSDTVFDGVTLKGGTGGSGSASGNASAFNLNTTNRFPGVTPTAAVSIASIFQNVNIAGQGSGVGGNGVGSLWSPRAVAVAESAGTAATGYGGSGSGAGSTGVPGPFAGGAGAPGAIYIRPLCP